METKTVKFRPSDITWIHGVAHFAPVGKSEENETEIPFSAHWANVLQTPVFAYCFFLRWDCDSVDWFHLDETLSKWTRQDDREHDAVCVGNKLLGIEVCVEDKK